MSVFATVPLGSLVGSSLRLHFHSFALVLVIYRTCDYPVSVEKLASGSLVGCGDCRDSIGTTPLERGELWE